MIGWLKRRRQEFELGEVTINLWIVSFKIGRKKINLPTEDFVSQPISLPPPHFPNQEPILDHDLTPDPLLAGEPKLTSKELEKPISLAGTNFEQQLRTNDRVAYLLKHKQNRDVASKAVTFFVNGSPRGTEYERGRETWKQIRGECLELIIEKLDQQRQRATYGSVAGIVGVIAHSVMSGKPKTHKNSWVVSAKTKLPTGYAAEERHSNFDATPNVISTPNELREWLRDTV